MGFSALKNASTGADREFISGAPRGPCQ